MTTAETSKHIESAAELLKALQKKSSVKISRRPIPWDNDIQLVDFFVQGDEEAELNAYLKDGCKPL